RYGAHDHEVRELGKPRHERLASEHMVGLVHHHEARAGFDDFDNFLLGIEHPGGVVGVGDEYEAGFSTRMRSMKAPASSEKSGRSGTPIPFMPVKTALSEYITKVGAGYIAAAPG